MKVTQSWDDGIVDDVKLVELLLRYRATATFNLNPGLHQPQRTFSWRYGEKEVWRLGRDVWPRFTRALKLPTIR